MKQTEIGLIPDDWEVVKLSKVAEIKAPMVNPRTKKYDFLPHIGNENIEKFSGKLLPYKLVGEENLISGKYFFKSTDVLYGKINPQFSKVAYPKFEGLCSADMYPLSASNEIIPEYLKYTLLTKAFYDYTVATSVRSGMPKVNRDEIAGYQFALPPIIEQKKIAEALSDIDSLICGIEEEIEKKKNIKTGAMQELLTGKRRLPGFAKSDKTKMTELGEIPENWEIITLGDLGELCMCKRILKEQTREKGDIPFYKIGTFGEMPDAYISRKLFEEYKEKYKYPKKETLLISAAGTIGRVIKFDGEESYFQDSNIVWIDNKEDKVINNYLYYCYKKIKWQTENGGTVLRLYNENIKATKFYAPKSIDEQHSIAAILTDMDEEIETLESKLSKYKNIKNGMMQQLLTGKIRLN